MLDSFIPSSVDYLEKSALKSLDQMAMPSLRAQDTADSHKKLSSSQTNDVPDRTQEPRFGFTNIGGTGTVSQLKTIISHKTIVAR